ncbi:MAG: hypothetical protein NT084_13530 [Bacteroidetes bacterium]|nr:hypothetical protein [Bacteroidota bacterium]
MSKGKLESWKVGKLESWKVGKLESWKVGKLESWKVVMTKTKCFITNLLGGIINSTANSLPRKIHTMKESNWK